MDEIKLTLEMYKIIRENDILYFREYSGKSEKKQKNWDSIQFNTLEFYSFLVNENYIKDKKIVSFFKPMIISWYENIYLNHFKQERIDDPNDYAEFKKLYKRLKC